LTSLLATLPALAGAATVSATTLSANEVASLLRLVPLEFIVSPLPLVS
jgi:hypothetical protein